MNKNVSPVNWYLGSYLSRFVVIGEKHNSDPERKFATWENTVIVKATGLDEAFDKVEAIGIDHAEPYLGGDPGVPVQWEYLGITELLPIYEDLVDGAEIMWASNNPRKLKNLKALVKSKSQIAQ